MREPTVRLRTPEQVDLQFSLAGVGARALAHLLDWLLLLAFAAAVIGLVAGWGQLYTGAHGLSVTAGGSLIGLLLCCLGYFFVGEGVCKGQTLGKKWLHVRVIGQDGSPVRLVAAIVRNVLRIVDFLPVGYLLGVGVMVSQPSERRLGDLAAGTVVVRDLPPTTLPPLDVTYFLQPAVDVLRVSLRKAHAQVVVRGPLPQRWQDLLVDFQRRNRKMAYVTRTEVTRHVWRQFVELPMVEVTADPLELSAAEMDSVLRAVERALRKQRGAGRSGQAGE